MGTTGVYRAGELAKATSESRLITNCWAPASLAERERSASIKGCPRCWWLSAGCPPPGSPPSPAPWRSARRRRIFALTGSSKRSSLGPRSSTRSDRSDTPWLVAEQLALGLDVIVECVNPIALTRDAWVKTGRAAAAGVVEVELVCSDAVEHQRRVESRPSDVKGLTKPAWDQVLGHEYEPWTRPHLVLDTAKLTVEVMVERITTEMQSTGVR